MTNAQLTQTAAEQWADGNPNAQTTQMAVEYWAVGGTPTIGIATQVAIEQWASSNVCVQAVTVTNLFGTSATSATDIYTYSR